MIRRYELAEVAAGEGLDTALGGADKEAQDQEIQQRMQREAHQTYHDIGDDPHQDHGAGGEALGQHPVQIGAGEGHQLHHQQHAHHAQLIDAHIVAKDRGHVDDGPHAVDIEKIGQQEGEERLIGADVPEGFAQAGEAAADQGAGAEALVGRAVQLLHIPQDGAGIPGPPQRCQQAGEAHGQVPGGLGLQGEKRPPKRRGSVERQGDHQGNGGAADIAEGIPGGGDKIHPLGGGDVHQHAVVINIGPVEADAGEGE